MSICQIYISFWILTFRFWERVEMCGHTQSKPVDDKDPKSYKSRPAPTTYQKPLRVFKASMASTTQSTVSCEPRPCPPQTCGDPRHAVPILRAYSPSAIDHFYTTDAAEHKHAYTKLGYKDEGTAGYVFSHKQPYTVPLYRLYSAGAKDHFYTTNEAEKDNAAAKLGYTNEGITGYVYPDPEHGAVPLYRLYSSGGTDHFYTTSGAERDHAKPHSGYDEESITGYIFPF